MASANPPGEPNEYRNQVLLDSVRHHVPLILVLTLLGLLLGLGVSLVRPPVYTTSASVLVNPLDGNPYSPENQGDSLVSLETEAQIVSSDAVTTQTAATLGDDPDPATLQRNVTAVVPPNTQIIEISFTSKTASFARDAAQAYADSYLDYREQRAEETIDANLDSIDQQTKQVLESLEQARDDAQNGTDIQQQFADELIASLNAQLVDLRTDRSTLTSEAPDPGRVISPAELPKRPAGISQVLYLLGGAAAGLLGGFVLAIARERRSDRLRHPDDPGRIGVTVLGRLAFVKNGLDHEGRETVRRIRTALPDPPSGPSIVAVAACADSAAVRGLPWFLANSLHAGGSRVVLVNATAFEPAPEGAFPRTHGAGLSDALRNPDRDVRELLVEGDPGFQLLPYGMAPDDADEHLLPAQITRVLRGLADEADHIVLRCPPADHSGGEALIASAGAAVLTVTLGTTTHGEINAAVAAVQRARSSLVGAVLTTSQGRSLRFGRRKRRAEASGRPAATPKDGSDESDPETADAGRGNGSSYHRGSPQESEDQSVSPREGTRARTTSR